MVWVSTSIEAPTCVITEAMHHYHRNAHRGGIPSADVVKLTLSVLAQLLLFTIWLSLPSRERYEVVVHIALPLLIVIPILKLRYLIVVPFLAFVPDIARLFDVDVFHSISGLPLVFARRCTPVSEEAKNSTHGRVCRNGNCCESLDRRCTETRGN